MGLRRKTFLYSVALAVIMIAFVIGYFVLMLPSLYVDYVMNSNLESAAEIQQGYMEERSYDHLTVKNPSATYTMEIPNTGDEVYITGKFFKLTITVQDEELRNLLDRARMMMEEGNLEQLESMSGQWQTKFKDIFAGQNLISEDAPVKVHLEQKGQSGEQVYQGEYAKMHTMSGDTIVYEAGVSDGNYSYTTYIAMGRTGCLHHYGAADDDAADGRDHADCYGKPADDCRGYISGSADFIGILFGKNCESDHQSRQSGGECGYGGTF